MSYRAWRGPAGALVSLVGYRNGVRVTDVHGEAALPEGLEWFGGDVATSAFYPATTPPAFYDPVENRSWFSYEAWNGTSRLLVVSTYNHTTGVWTGPDTAITNPLENDDHGVPAMVMDDDGYVHIFGASHGSSAQKHASTTSPRDPSEWSATTNLAAATYPHPNFVDGALYVFLRDGGSNDHRLIMQKTTALVDGVPTFASSVFIGTMGAENRWYQGNNVVVGADIHMVATAGVDTDSKRQDVYYLIYDTLTGNVENFDGSVVIEPGSFPIERTTLDTSFRIVDQTTGDTEGNVPQFEIVDGVAHVTYTDGVSGDFRLYHISNTLGSSGAWTTALEIGVFHDNDDTHRRDGQTVTASAETGAVDIWWCAEFGSFIRGGKIVKRTRAANGTLSAQEDVKSPDRIYAFHPVVMVRDGHADMRAVFAEFFGTTGQEQQMRVYVAGDRGVVERPIEAPASINIDFTSETYNGANFVVSRLQSDDTFASRLDGSWATFDSYELRRTDKGLLVEPETANLLISSRNLNTASGWTENGIVVTVDQEEDADGLTELDLLNKNTGSAGRSVNRSITGEVSVTYAYSVNAKAGTLSTFSIRMDLGAELTGKQFNLTTGEITDFSTPQTQGLVSASAEDLGDGIWRCTVVATAPASGTTHVFRMSPGNLTTSTTGTVYAGSAQAEVGTEPSSLILSAVTPRPADVIYFGVPTSVTTLTYTFDDDSTQEVEVTNHGAHQIPVDLDRRYIKTIVGS